MLRILLQLWLDPYTVAKISVYGSDYQPAVREEISPENLPVEYGGTGLLPEGLRVWNDEDWWRYEKKRCLPVVDRLTKGNGQAVGRAPQTVEFDLASSGDDKMEVQVRDEDFIWALDGTLLRVSTDPPIVMARHAYASGRQCGAHPLRSRERRGSVGAWTIPAVPCCTQRTTSSHRTV